MTAARIAILAAALAAAAACQAQAAIRFKTTTAQPAAGDPPAARQLPTRICRPHYEWGGPSSQRPQRPDDIYVYYIDSQCHKTLVRVIHNPKRIVKVTR